MTDASTGITVRGHPISEDSQGRLCLDDLWSLAGSKLTKAPKHWRTQKAATLLIDALQKKVTASYLNDGALNVAVIAAERGRGSKGTYAHPVLAAAYAGYLSPKLEIEIREVWLRYRAGDATLADAVLQRASAEANQWAGARALSRSRRNAYTDTLKDHGVVEKGYLDCTEAVYLNLLGGRSYELRKAMGLPAKTNLRDHLGADKLAFLMAAEVLAAERIREEGRQGNHSCTEASAICAAALRGVVEADRASRRGRIGGIV